MSQGYASSLCARIDTDLRLANLHCDLIQGIAKSATPALDMLSYILRRQFLSTRRRRDSDNQVVAGRVYASQSS